MSKEIVYVKLGGSFITLKDKPFTLNIGALDKAVAIIKNTWRKVSLLLGNGGGSFAHPVVRKYKNACPEELLVRCHSATRKLNHIIVDKLLENNILATTIQTSAIIMKQNNEYKVFIDPVKTLVEKGIIPVLYGECIINSKNTYTVLSTENVFKILSNHIKPSRIVLLTDVDGVYDKNPKKHRDAKIINVINRRNLEEVLEILSLSKDLDETGSMYGKIKSTAELSEELGIPVYIVSGFNTEEAIKAILGKPLSRGTIIDMR